VVEGSTIRWQFTCRDTDGELFTPTTRRLDVVKGDGTQLDDVSTSLVGLGVYEAKVLSVLGDSGDWRWEWTITNAEGDVLVTQNVEHVVPQLIPT